jgi:hypothetical protein
MRCRWRTRLYADLKRSIKNLSAEVYSRSVYGLQMRLFLPSLIVSLLCAALACSQHSQPCADFDRTIAATYNFRPSQLASDDERNKKSAELDKVWESVKQNPTQFLPCLRRALENPNANAWFRFDGSNLLVSIDPSETSKKLQIRSYAAANLDDVDLRVWVTTLVRLAFEGLDVSEPAERWLAYPQAKYFLPEHGAYEVGMPQGALFIFGSMDEAQATPTLQRVVNQTNHPGREVALRILLNENTSESLRVVNALDVSNFSPKAQEMIRNELSHPDVFEPRPKPKNTRQEFVDAFNRLLNGDSSLFFGLVAKVPDGERDVVATMTSQDLPLLRKVRRRMITASNQHAIEYYDSFTKIIRTIVRANDSKSQ